MYSKISRRVLTAYVIGPNTSGITKSFGAEMRLGLNPGWVIYAARRPFIEIP